ncbi:unnamed protein product [Cuscuta epithymum]|uniref:GRF-type domain-containing protein n=1 Tax=Cuscuta epithymum TaxID=186058 RepID=A0AAV0FDV8_9ASTE|nr:unnamed protein product [Cuscuta epithymum]
MPSCSSISQSKSVNTVILSSIMLNLPKVATLKRKLHVLNLREDPGLHFYKCESTKNGCGYFEWHNEALLVRAKDMINEMKLERKILEAENKRFKKIKCHRYNHGARSGRTVGELNRLKNRAKSANEERPSQLERVKLEGKKKTALIIAIISWIVLAMVLVVNCGFIML